MIGFYGPEQRLDLTVGSVSVAASSLSVEDMLFGLTRNAWYNADKHIVSNENPDQTAGNHIVHVMEPVKVTRA